MFVTVSHIIGPNKIEIEHCVCVTFKCVTLS